MKSRQVFAIYVADPAFVRQYLTKSDTFGHVTDGGRFTAVPIWALLRVWASHKSFKSQFGPAFKLFCNRASGHKRWTFTQATHSQWMFNVLDMQHHRRVDILLEEHTHAQTYLFHKSLQRRTKVSLYLVYFLSIYARMCVNTWVFELGSGDPQGASRRF